MPFSTAFLSDYRSAGSPPAQLERVLAVGRAFLTVTGLLAIFLDPTEPTRLLGVTYGVLLAYALYSLAVLLYVHRAERLTPGHGTVLHGFDIAWASALTFVSEGPVSPFFLFFLFVLLAAAYRGGFGYTVGTAVVTVAVFLLETAIAVANPWKATLFAPFVFELNSTILRVGYLLLTGVLLGYLAEQDKRSRAELAAIADATRQPRVNLGLNGSVAALARMLLSTFSAAATAVVIDDHQSRRTLLWHLTRDEAPKGQPRVKRSELTASKKGDWLFSDFATAWYATPDRESGGHVILAAQPALWPLTRTRAELPADLYTVQPFQRLTTVNMGLAGEWSGRVYLFDAMKADSPERTLHFLEELSAHVTPALTNVFLLRRLRVRAGAVERARVARELHDGAIQALLGIEMKLEAFRRASDRSPEFVDKEVGEVQDLLRREVLSLRELMQALRPLEIEGVDQVPDVLAALVERFRRDTGIYARFVLTGGDLTLPPRRALELVRIVQEALANVRRHAHADNVLVSLTSHDGECRLVIEDDGCGFGFEGRLSAQELDRRHVGPAVIKERARIAGAQLAVESSPGAGARVELVFAGATDHV